MKKYKVIPNALSVTPESVPSDPAEFYAWLKALADSKQYTHVIIDIEWAVRLAKKHADAS